MFFTWCFPFVDSKLGQYSILDVLADEYPFIHRCPVWAATSVYNFRVSLTLSVALMKVGEQLRMDLCDYDLSLPPDHPYNLAVEFLGCLMCVYQKGNRIKTTTPPKFSIAPEKWWLEACFLLGRPIFKGYVKLREGTCLVCLLRKAQHKPHDSPGMKKVPY